MKQYMLYARKHLIKPIVFGTVLLGFAALFFDGNYVDDLRDQEQARYNQKRQEVLEMRKKLLEDLAKKKQEQEND